MLRNLLAKRHFTTSFVSQQDVQFYRMQALYQGYFTQENQRKIICIGRNYHAHVAELSNKVPTEPLWFDKPLSSLLTPGQAFMLAPHHVDVHHEIELGIVIGMRGRNIRPENVHKHIGGYFVGVDFTDRVLQDVNKAAGSDWCLAKGTNQFAAVSEFIHQSAVADVADVEIEL